MTRKLALVAGALFTVVSAGALHAQASTTTKPSSSSMQHTTSPTTAKSQHQDTTSAKTTSKMAVRHAQWSKEQVTEAQQGLAKDGFYKGKPNGSYDRKTRNAIKAYQKSNKLPVTGHLSDSLLTRLKSS